MYRRRGTEAQRTQLIATDTHALYLDDDAPLHNEINHVPSKRVTFVCDRSVHFTLIVVRPLVHFDRERVTIDTLAKSRPEVSVNLDSPADNPRCHYVNGFQLAVAMRVDGHAAT